MTKTVRAAVMTSPGAIELQKFERPQIEPGAVLIKVLLSGICGTDKHTFRGETLQYAGTPHEREVQYPIICGHENVGVIEEIGGSRTVFDSDGEALRVGDRVVPAANVVCGHCWYCRNGHPYYLCEQMDDYGNSLDAKSPPHLFGGWSELLYTLPGTNLFRVPDELPDEVAVLTEIMAVTHGFELARRLSPTPFGESVVVIGVGPLGMCHAIKARLLGCGPLIVVDVMASRVEMAADFGASDGICSAGMSEEELVANIRDRTGGRGADIVLDCSGVPQTFTAALRMTRPGGTVVESGAFVDLGPVEVNPNSDICTRDVNVLGIGGETADSYKTSMALMGANLHRMPLDRFVTHRFSLDRAQEAVELAQTDEALKVVLDPQMGASAGGLASELAGP